MDAQNESGIQTVISLNPKPKIAIWNVYKKGQDDADLMYKSLVISLDKVPVSFAAGA